MSHCHELWCGQLNGVNCDALPGFVIRCVVFSDVVLSGSVSSRDVLSWVVWGYGVLGCVLRSCVVVS